MKTATVRNCPSEIDQMLFEAQVKFLEILDYVAEVAPPGPQLGDIVKDFQEFYFAFKLDLIVRNLGRSGSKRP